MKGEDGGGARRRGESTFLLFPRDGWSFLSPLAILVHWTSDFTNYLWIWLCSLVFLENFHKHTHTKKSTIKVPEVFHSHDLFLSFFCFAKSLLKCINA